MSENKVSYRHQVWVGDKYAGVVQYEQWEASDEGPAGGGWFAHIDGNPTPVFAENKNDIAVYFKTRYRYDAATPVFDEDAEIQPLEGEVKFIPCE